MAFRRQTREGRKKQETRRHLQAHNKANSGVAAPRVPRDMKMEGSIRNCTESKDYIQVAMNREKHLQAIWFQIYTGATMSSLRTNY